MRLISATLFLAVVPGFPAALPLFFFPSATPTQYIVQTPDLSARFQPDSVVFQVHGQQIGVRFVGANPDAPIVGLEPLAAKVNFFVGTGNWKTNVPSYSKIVYRGLYPGIDLTYAGTGRLLKSEFLLAPHANPAVIRLKFSEPVSIDAQGNLIAGGAGDIFREDAPEIYQQRGGGRVKIAGRYRLLNEYTVVFEIGPYDTSAPLVIDPPITYCTYLGGTGNTDITGVAIDSSDNLYVTGWTEAINFPVAGAIDAANQGGVDVIVAKLNPAGSVLIYATYIGGRSDDRGAAIAVDRLGQAYVTGSTSSTNFPLVLSNRPSLGGSTAAFALKINATGNALLYSGYLGGTNYEVGTAIAVDASSNAYIVGDTQSANFPTFLPTQPTIGGGVDAFVTKLSSGGAMVFSTFLGGAGNEHAGGIAVDNSGNIFVAGGTFSTNFPVAAPFQATSGGFQDAFVTKISNAGAIAFSTYLGGNGGPGSPEQANAIALDSAGNPYIAGVTGSTNFPVTGGAFQTSLGGAQNVFIVRMTNSGQALAYSTYLGGVGTDWASGIAVSAAGNAYVSGYTSSVNFPQSNAVQAAFGGLYDAFISELSFTGNNLIFSTYYGGSGSDSANAIALDASNNIFIGGETGSRDLPLLHPLQSTNLASISGWLLRLGATGLPSTIPSVTSLSPVSSSGASATFTAVYADTAGGAALTTGGLMLNTSGASSYGCYVTYTPQTSLFSLYDDSGTVVLGTVSAGGGSIQNSQCTLNGAGSSASVFGTTLTVAFSLTFLPTFPGLKTVYLLAADVNSNTGFIAEGTFNVTMPSGAPTVVSVSPNAGGGSMQTFTFVYGDTVLAGYLTSVSFLFNTSVNLTRACYVVFDLAANTISLATDNAQSTTAKQLNSPTVLQNTQCQIGATSASINGLSLPLTATVTFNTGFGGVENIYMNAAQGGLNTGWVLEGTYTAPFCSFAPTPLATFVGYAGGTGPINVIAGTGCAWTATSNASWLTVTSASGSGNGMFSFSATANAGTARMANISVVNAVVDIMQGGSPTSPLFNDVPSSDPYFDYVSLMFNDGITAGCSTSPPLYCPTTPVTRAQMSVFIVAALDRALGTPLTYTQTPYFQDVPANSVYFPFVQRIKDLGITAGCSTSPPLFCPDTSISQGQMAVFMIVGWMVANNLSTFSYTATPYFTDVPSTDLFFMFVQKMRDMGFWSGCSPTLYCENSAVTRGQMAPMIMRSMLGAP